MFLAVFKDWSGRLVPGERGTVLVIAADRRQARVIFRYITALITETPMIAGLVDGTIEAIATDHAPHSREEKDVPFEEAPFGVTGLETAFAALYTHLVEPGLLTLETLLERMSAGPARAYGLEPPRIAVGAPANLVLLDPNASWRVEERVFRSRSANSWLLGQTLRSKIRLTIAAGRVACAG